MRGLFDAHVSVRVPPMMSYRDRKRAERNAEIRRLAELKVPTKRIARILRVSEKVVRDVRKEAGLVTPKTQPLTEEQIAFAERLLRDGTSRREAARSIGCSSSQLNRVLPDLSWDREQQTQVEHEIGIRQRINPVLARTPKQRRVRGSET